MRHLPRRPHLAREPSQRRSIACQRIGKELQRYGLAKPEVVGAVDLSHAPAADLRDHAIAFGDYGSGNRVPGL